jgi:CTP:molybdopterin cytidylyltransferase MocA
VTREACASSADQVWVVLGASEARIQPVLAGLRAEPIANVVWEEGVASSIRCAARLATRRGVGALILALGDQPALTGAHLDRLAAEHRRGAKVAASRYAGTLGVPALFDRTFLWELLALQGDTGAKSLLRRLSGVTAIDWPEGELDIDTAEDVAALHARA